MKTETLKKIVELADGFEVIEDVEGIGDICNYDRSIMSSPLDEIHEYCHYPLLLRRAIEGWNRKYGRTSDYQNTIELCADVLMTFIDYEINKVYRHKEYEKTDYLTPQEQAIEACLIELLEK